MSEIEDMIELLGRYLRVIYVSSQLRFYVAVIIAGVKVRCKKLGTIPRHERDPADPASVPPLNSITKEETTDADGRRGEDWRRRRTGGEGRGTGKRSVWTVDDVYSDGF